MTTTRLHAYSVATTSRVKILEMYSEFRDSERMN